MKKLAYIPEARSYVFKVQYVPLPCPSGSWPASGTLRKILVGCHLLTKELG